MNGKLYIKKFIRDDGETLSFDAEEIYLSENNTLLVRSDPATTAVEFTEEDGGEMIRQRGATYSQPVSGLIVPKSTEYWALCVRLSRFFILNHTYKIVYIKRDGSMFSMNRAWINAGLQIVPVPYENYSTWTIEFRIGDNFWTEYAEDGQGKEIYSNSIELPLLTAGTGGEVWNDATQQTLSGLGNYFTIDGTSISASMNKLEVRGDAFQQTYTGKNLSPYPYADGNSKVTRGITFTVASDGSVTLNGTNDNAGNSAYYICYGASPLLQFEAGTYYFVPPSNTSVGYVMYDGTSYYDFSSSNNYSQTFSSVKNIRDIYIQVRRGDTTVFNNLKIYPMLTTSPSPTESDYEPYTGSTPSQLSPAPNPDYPQDIQVVTGEQTVTVTGKNKINGSYSEISQTARGTAEASGNGFKITSTSSSGAVYVTVPIPNITPLLGQTVTVSYSSSGSGVRTGFFYLNSNEAATGNISYTQTTTLPSSLGNNAGIGVVFYTSNDGSATYNDIQLEIGSTATTYEPYQSQAYKINLGKNIWNSSMEVGGISVTGTSLNNNKRVRSTTKVAVRPGTTYTLSAIPRDNGKVINVAIQGWASDDTFISQITGADWQTLPLTFTTPANCYKVTLNGRYSDDTVFGTVGESTNAFLNIQLEVGANATEYAPYFTPVELCKIGDYQDYIYKSGDDWYLHKEVGKTLVTGSSSESWLTQTTNVGYMYRLTLSGVASNPVTEIANLRSDYFMPITGGQIYNVTSGGFISQLTTAGYIRFNIGDTTDKLSDFKTWLSSHNATVYYALATPTDTKITDATLVGQLEALAGAQAYNGKTVYQTNSATMPAILSVELLQSVGGGETWDNVGTVWEEGVGGVQTINVETTQTTYPVWTVTGPCSNPTLQNDTTDTIASFDGMIASGQTLTVDFADNTAYLDSAPVAKYVSGYISLAPGENVIGFNSDGGSTQTSTISWDNIIN